LRGHSFLTSSSLKHVGLPGVTLCVCGTSVSGTLLQAGGSFLFTSCCRKVFERLCFDPFGAGVNTFSWISRTVLSFCSSIGDFQRRSGPRGGRLLRLDARPNLRRCTSAGISIHVGELRRYSNHPSVEVDGGSGTPKATASGVHRLRGCCTWFRTRDYGVHPQMDED